MILGFRSKKPMDRAHAFELTLPVNPADHTIGPLHAPVTVVEYGDLECLAIGPY